MGRDFIAQSAGLGRIVSSLAELPLIALAWRWFARALEIGTSGYPEDARRRLKIVNCIAYLIGLVTAAYVVQYSLADYEKYKLLIWLNAVLVLLVVAVPYAHRFNDIAGGLLIVVVEFAALFVITMLLGRDSASHLHYMIAPAAGLVPFGLHRPRMVSAIIASGIILFIAAHFLFPPEQAWIKLGPDIINPLFVQTAITVGVLIAASVWYAFSLAEQARVETDRLLHNILPASIVERLKQRPDGLIANAHDNVSVLFTDISGFVALSMALGPQRVVALLNDIVCEFDELATRHGVEKIKTIGDAYMAVSGVPEPRPDHARACVLLALDMQGVIERIKAAEGVDLAIRIGIATGPVLAGIIGRDKFSYDVWGDTVNLASRLEGASERGRILICDTTHRVLGEAFDCEAAGRIPIKGQGEQPAWFIMAPSAN